MKYFMTQWYVFTPLTQAELLGIQTTLREIGKTQTMNGLILLATEGCNGTVAGSEEAISAMKEYLTTIFNISNFQGWESDVKPFKRFKVDIREEIVALKHGDIRPRDNKDHLSPHDFHHMIEREDVTILDTRNAYETAIGTFEKSVVPSLASFHEFPKFVAESDIPKDKPVALFCTSGIRCEKAAQEMREQGYKEVYQLDGGITNYLQEYPDGHWQGECFMFDHRVAVDTHLQPSKRYALCPSCGNPGDVQTVCEECATPCILCKTCLETEPATCSKACKSSLRTKVAT